MTRNRDLIIKGQETRSGGVANFAHVLHRTVNEIDAREVIRSTMTGDVSLFLDVIKT